MGMDTVELVLRIALVLDALALITLIMIQQGKGANVGAAFGSGASQTMFGSAGATSFLNSLTTWLAVAFFAITFGLAWAARERAEGLGSVGIPKVEVGVDAAPVDAGEVPALEAVPMDALPEGDVPVFPTEAAPELDDEVPGVDSRR